MILRLIGANQVVVYLVEVAASGAKLWGKIGIIILQIFAFCFFFSFVFGFRKVMCRGGQKNKKLQLSRS